MTDIRVDSPDLYTTKRVDKEGRMFLGKEYVDRQFEIVLKEVDEDDGSS